MAIPLSLAYRHIKPAPLVRWRLPFGPASPRHESGAWHPSSALSHVGNGLLFYISNIPCSQLESHRGECQRNKKKSDGASSPDGLTLCRRAIFSLQQDVTPLSHFSITLSPVCCLTLPARCGPALGKQCCAGFLCESRDNEKSFICPRLHGFLLHTDRKPFFLRVKDTTSPAH